MKLFGKFLKPYLWIALLLILPITVVVLFNRTSTLSLRNFLENIAGTLFFVDLPIGMCMLHYYRPQLFRHHKKGHYSIVPWGIFFLACWGIVVSATTLYIKLGSGPMHGVAVICAYLFGWAYIWVTMIPIGLLYLLFRLIKKLYLKWK